ncbi:MAG: hypothetical protein KDA64_06745 [Rhodospirillaceae bacterium]|nr:hypothetical protein [Rhodospirillaceae bacterium]
MTGRKDNPGRPLDLLTEFLVEDILNTPDEEILAEFEEAGGDPEAHAAEMRAFLEESILTSNKAKMAAAKAGVAAARRLGRPQMHGPINIDDARRRLRLLSEAGNATPDLTLAARKETELSDADVLGLIEELEELEHIGLGSDNERD